MRQLSYLLLMIGLLVGTIGCCCERSALSPQRQGISSWLRGSCDRAPENCQSCSPRRPCRESRCGRCAETAAPAGAVAYPYYTNRGPRDFLAKNPQSIGP